MFIYLLVENSGGFARLKKLACLIVARAGTGSKDLGRITAVLSFMFQAAAREGVQGFSAKMEICRKREGAAFNE